MRAIVAILLVALCVPVAGAASVRSVRAPAPVLALAHDGSFVAFAAGRSARDCNRVYLWNLTTRAVTRLGRRTHCVETSTGNAISSLALAGRRVLWLHFSGGNRRNYTLWTATPTRTAPRLVSSQEVDVDDPAPIVVGEGDHSRLGSLLPWARGRDVFAMRADGSRALFWRAPARVVSLAALDGELAVATSDRRVTVLDASGRVLRSETYATDVDVVRLTGSRIVVQRGRTIELRGGHVPLTWELPRGSRLEDAEGGWAYYVSGTTVHRLSLLADNITEYLSGGFRARVEGSRLSSAAIRVVGLRPVSD